MPEAQPTGSAEPIGSAAGAAEIGLPPPEKRAPVVAFDDDTSPAYERLLKIQRGETAAPAKDTEQADGETAETEHVEGEPELDAAAEAPAEETEEPDADPEGFDFLGQHFGSREAAEAFFRKQANDLKASHGRLAKTNEAIRLSQAWRAHAEKLEAEIARLKQVSEQAPGQEGENVAADGKPRLPLSPKQEQALVRAIDWPLFRELYDEKGPDFAIGWVLDKLDKHQGKIVDALRTEFEAKLEKLQKPIEEARSVAETDAQAVEFFRSKKLEVYPEGHPKQGYALYPEMQDARAVEAIAEIWTTLDPAFAFTDNGFVAAVSIYRQALAERAVLEQSRSQSADEVVRAAKKPRNAISGNGTPRVATGGGADKAAAFVRAITDSGSQYNEFGFRR